MIRMPWAVCYRRREPGLHLVSSVALDKSVNRSELPYLLYIVVIILPL